MGSWGPGVWRGAGLLGVPQPGEKVTPHPGEDAPRRRTGRLVGRTTFKISVFYLMFLPPDPILLLEHSNFGEMSGLGRTLQQTTVQVHAGFKSPLNKLPSHAPSKCW